MPISRSARKSKLKLSGLFKKVENATSTQLLYVLLLVAVFLVGYLIARVQALEEFGGKGAQDTAAAANGTQPAPSGPPVKVDVDTGHLPPLGNKDAKVTLVEFSDMQCPFCRAYYEGAYQQIKKDYIDTGKVVLYFRHYPLPFHPQAQISAEALECANEQGKMWELHDLLFDKQQAKDPSGGTVEFTPDDLKSWAAEVVPDTTTFNSCLDSNKYKEAVAKDTQDGQTAGVNGTPSFFVNGYSLVGAQPYESFKALIDQELAK